MGGGADEKSEVGRRAAPAGTLVVAVAAPSRSAVGGRLAADGTRVSRVKAGEVGAMPDALYCVWIVTLCAVD